MAWHGMAWHGCEAAEVNADFACRSVRSSFELLLPRFRSPALNPGGIASSESWQKKAGTCCVHLCPSVSSFLNLQILIIVNCRDVSRLSSHNVRISDGLFGRALAAELSNDHSDHSEPSPVLPWVLHWEVWQLVLATDSC